MTLSGIFLISGSIFHFFIRCATTGQRYVAPEAFRYFPSLLQVLRDGKGRKEILFYISIAAKFSINFLFTELARLSAASSMYAFSLFIKTRFLIESLELS